MNTIEEHPAGPTGPVRSWGWSVLALLQAGVVLAVLPVAPRLWFAVLPYLRPHVTLWFVAASLLGLLVLLRWSTAAPRNRGRALAALLGLLLLAVAQLVVYYGHEAPAKKFHLFEYGVLAILALQAVRVEPERPAGILLAAGFLLVVGTVDEVSQGFIPMRTFRWLDLFGNHLSSAQGALAWIAASPLSPWRRAEP